MNSCIEKENKLHTCCFIGHRTINETDTLKNRLYTIIEKLITKSDIDTFLFGSKSKFDDLCHKVVTGLKEKYPHIKRIYVRAEFPHIDDSYKRYLLQKYEYTYFPERIINAGKAAYVERNYEMLDKSCFCVTYFDESYAPTSKKSGKKALINRQPKSGTKIAFDYAAKRQVKVLNVFEAVPVFN